MFQVFFCLQGAARWLSLAPCGPPLTAESSQHIQQRNLIPASLLRPPGSSKSGRGQWAGGGGLPPGDFKHVLRDIVLAGASGEGTVMTTAPTNLKLCFYLRLCSSCSHIPKNAECLIFSSFLSYLQEKGPWHSSI